MIKKNFYILLKKLLDINKLDSFNLDCSVFLKKGEKFVLKVIKRALSNINKLKKLSLKFYDITNDKESIKILSKIITNN